MMMLMLLMLLLAVMRIYNVSCVSKHMKGCRVVMTSRLYMITRKARAVSSLRSAVIVCGVAAPSSSRQHSDNVIISERVTPCGVSTSP